QRYCIPNDAEDTTNNRVLRLNPKAHPLSFINDNDVDVSVAVMRLAVTQQVSLTDASAPGKASLKAVMNSITRVKKYQFKFIDAECNLEAGSAYTPLQFPAKGGVTPVLDFQSSAIQLDSEQ
ncbi:hypothetical protein MC885_004557, partial [Smutsia gigantea]